MPKSLDYYLEAFLLCYEARIFISNSYPLMMKIKGKEDSKLFAENIFFMEMTLENLHKYMIDHPVESLVEILPYDEAATFMQGMFDDPVPDISENRNRSRLQSGVDMQDLMLQKNKSTMSYLSHKSTNENAFVSGRVHKKPKKMYPVYAESSQFQDVKDQVRKLHKQLEN
jgi:hypothetical protein